MRQAVLTLSCLRLAGLAHVPGYQEQVQQYLRRGLPAHDTDRRGKRRPTLSE